MAWKRDDPPSPNPHPEPAAPRPTVAPASAAAPEPSRRPSERATIGPSIYIKGDLAGEEDLVIEGRVEGRVDLKQHNVTIGKNGRVRADVFGRVVNVEGEVDGNVFAQEQAVLRQSGAVRGNITSPRVTLEDGSRFKGSIDMEPKDGGKPAISTAANPPKRENEAAGAAASGATAGRPAGV